MRFVFGSDQIEASAGASNGTFTIASAFSPQERAMTDSSQERKYQSHVEVRVADEGNVPGHPSMRAIFCTVLALVLGLCLMYLGTTYGPFHSTYQ
jgi:hypothetical protein